jgi:hypothetical protein
MDTCDIVTGCHTEKYYIEDLVIVQFLDGTIREIWIGEGKIWEI